MVREFASLFSFRIVVFLLLLTCHRLASHSYISFYPFIDTFEFYSYYFLCCFILLLIHLSFIHYFLFNFYSKQSSIFYRLLEIHFKLFFCFGTYILLVVVCLYFSCLLDFPKLISV